jgi:hypothetical protein
MDTLRFFERWGKNTESHDVTTQKTFSSTITRGETQKTVFLLLKIRLIMIALFSSFIVSASIMKKNQTIEVLIIFGGKHPCIHNNIT